ncbi:RagB/SusD family nutrient uptake outer membrane protein [Litoribacter ruber]|uniref:RagB/SusD family nutrient uptake outer membrane protein n=1 Tax=Litoribacter ruber TaxID=702568 RepID=UPI001BDADB52|nr:RagB/SusD family nutrient uptake outer membrane protein [Litoribacter ruber]MBT0812840.1 RagB/SusD family nutrient uptake outer membrane protein [Litoribacter ruber]
MKITSKILYITIFAATTLSCQNILDEKPDRSLVVPTKLSELQAMLDNTNQVMNREAGLPELAADHVALPESLFPQVLVEEVNSHFWSEDILESMEAGEWGLAYSQIFYANIVLKELERFNESEKASADWRNVKGSALFYRAYAYFTLARTYALPYPATGAEGIVGLPLRTAPEVTNDISRSDLASTFNLIVNDLNEASTLLFDRAAYPSRPSKWAAFGMLSRVHLYMGNYAQVIESSNQCLALGNTLMDYRDYEGATGMPFSLFNEETIFYSEMVTYLYQLFWGSTISESFYAKYSDGDLRRDLFFNQREDRIEFVGSYSGTMPLFSGIAVDEVILNRAEAYAWLGDEAAAIADLNSLLEKRFDDSFTPIEAEKDVISRVLEEREKQLLLRGLRWGDIKRLNSLENQGIVITREREGVMHELTPGSNRYAFPIPDIEITQSGIPQNPR